MAIGSNPQPRLECQLDSGHIVPFDTALGLDFYQKYPERVPDPGVFDYIGDGTLWAVDGVRMKGMGDRCRHYVRKSSEVTTEALASGKRAALDCIGIIRDSSDRHIVIATIKERYGLE